MPQTANVTLAPRAWTPLTNAAVTALRVQNLTRWPILLQATVGAVPPTADAAGKAGAIKLGEDMVLGADRPLSELWPGLTGANRVYAWTDIDGEASVSHA